MIHGLVPERVKIVPAGRIPWQPLADAHAHWIMCGFLIVPCALFYGYMGNPLLLTLSVATLLCVTPWFRSEHETAAIGRASGRTLAVACASAAVGLTIVGGEGRIMPATADWLIRDAILRDLVAQAWPFVYRVNGQDWALRAPLGMYLLPALIGKLLGLYGAHLALWAQNSLCLFAVLRVLTCSTSLARSLVVLVVFCVFSGLDMVGGSVFAALRETLLGVAFHLPADIEWWATLFQYSSTMTLIFWVPHHALAGWFTTAMLLLWERRRCGIAALMMSGLLSVVWSPFALVGGAPFLAKAGIEAVLQRQVSRLDVAATALLAAMLLPLAVYLTSDAGAVMHGFQTLSARFWLRYALFIAVEILPFIVVNACFGASRAGFSPWTYRLAILCLLVIPLYRINVSNDFVMRASIPALAIMAVTTGHTAYDAFCRRRWWPAAIMAIVLGLGSLTGASEIWAIAHSGNNGFSTCDFIRAWDQSPYSSQMPNAIYLAHRDETPPFLGPPEVFTTAPTPARCAEQRL